MPIGIVSEEDYLREKSKLVDDIAMPSVVIRDMNNPGRGKDSTEVPAEVRKMIGEVGILDRSGAVDLAKSLGISRSSVSAYVSGATSTSSYKEKDKELANFIRGRKNVIAKKASNRLISALNEITDNKLADAKLSEIADVASKMSAIIKNMDDGPVDNKGNKSQQQFVIFAPMVKSEEAFETIYSVE